MCSPCVHCTAAWTNVQERYADCAHLVACAGFSPTEAVAAQAVLHLRCKALSVPAVLLLFVQHGAFRGARDTRCAQRGAAQHIPLLYPPSNDSRECSLLGQACQICTADVRLRLSCTAADELSRRVELVCNCLQDPAPGGCSAERRQPVAGPAAHPGPGRGHCARPFRVGSAGTLCRV